MNLMSVPKHSVGTEVAFRDPGDKDNIITGTVMRITSTVETDALPRAYYHIQGDDGVMHPVAEEHVMTCSHNIPVPAYSIGDMVTFWSEVTDKTGKASSVEEFDTIMDIQIHVQQFPKEGKLFDVIEIRYFLENMGEEKYLTQDSISGRMGSIYDTADGVK